MNHCHPHRFIGLTDVTISVLISGVLLESYATATASTTHEQFEEGIDFVFDRAYEEALSSMSTYVYVPSVSSIADDFITQEYDYETRLSDDSMVRIHYGR
jgi:hypothetical protein